ncbi:hypothetical protein LguiB_006155 [Lonicera macranthoides]
MADIKADTTSQHQHRLIVTESEAPVAVEVENEEEKPRRQTKRQRVASVDIFRGFTVALMILVDDAGGEWPMIGHAPWNGCNLADFVMPFFLFIVGMSIALALKRISDRLIALRKVILRTLKLLFWGLLLQGYVDREIMGINHMYEDPAWKRSKLYTLSYVCVTSGAAALVFSAFYILVDTWKLKYLFLPFEWIGMNVMLVYVMAAEGSFAGFINGWYYDNPHNTLGGQNSLITHTDK